MLWKSSLADKKTNPAPPALMIVPTSKGDFVKNKYKMYQSFILFI